MSKSQQSPTQQSNQVAGKVWVRTQFGHDKSDIIESDRDLEVNVYPANVPIGKVKASCGLTLNIGNYESARVDAGVELPCAVEEVSMAFNRAWEIVQEEIHKQGLRIRAGGA